MIVFICKFLHLISLFIAGGGGIGNAVIQSIYKKEGKIPEPHLAKSFRVLAFISLIAVIVMWVTGIILAILIYGGFNLGWPFHLKMFGATTLLAVVASLNIHLMQQAKAGKPPNPKVMKFVPPIARTSLVLVLIGVALLTT